MEKDELLKNMSSILDECYSKAKETLGDEFDSVMADVTAEILDAQSKMKKHLSFASVALIMSMPDDDASEEDKEQLTLFCKAAIVWHFKEEKKLSETNPHDYLLMNGYDPDKLVKDGVEFIHNLIDKLKKEGS